MNASDWISLAALLVAVVGTGGAIRYARKSAKAAEDAVGAARKSAAEATALTAIEAERRAEEKDRWHHELAPQLPDEIAATLERDPQGRGSLFGTITLSGSKAYRVTGEALFANGSGSTPVSLPLIMEPGTHRVHIEHWAPGQEQQTIKALALRFWCPAERDPTETWSCPCGKPTAETASKGGHWTRTVPVTYTHRQPKARGFDY